MIIHSSKHASFYICLLAVATILSTTVNVPTVDASIGCSHYNGGSTCPPQAPCCQSGWCSNAMSFCSLALGCQPENSHDSNTCLPLPQCVSFTEDFQSSDTVIGQANFSGNPQDAAWTSDFQPSNAHVENGNLVLRIQKGNTINKFGNKPGFGATVSSTRWMLYGTVSARIKSGSWGGGIISSFIFRSALTGDEIDYEWVGRDRTEVQSNYYWRTPANMDPKDIDYSHSRRQDIGIIHAQDYQTYTIEWLPDSLTWSINGKVIRTLLRSEVNETKYPSTPSQIQFSIWDGGLSDPETREWAGGPTAWEEGQPAYEMMIDWVDIKCHTPVDPVLDAWPPKDQGFQGFVNPLAKDLSSPLAKEAIVLGSNAPKFSTLDQGGLHWGRFNAGGKTLVGTKPHSSKSLGISRFGVGAGVGSGWGWESWMWKSIGIVVSVLAFHALA